MEITHEDKLKISEEKDNIKKICDRILDLHNYFRNNKSEIFKRISQVLSHASTISNYSGSEKDVKKLKRIFSDIQDRWNSEGCDDEVKSLIQEFCNEANSISCDYFKPDKKLTIIIKIRELILNKIGL